MELCIKDGELDRNEDEAIYSIMHSPEFRKIKLCQSFVKFQDCEINWSQCLSQVQMKYLKQNRNALFDLVSMDDILNFLLECNFEYTSKCNFIEGFIQCKWDYSIETLKNVKDLSYLIIDVRFI